MYMQHLFSFLFLGFLHKNTYLCTRKIAIASLNGGMVDTKDLKSFDHCGCAGSSPASGTEVDCVLLFWLQNPSGFGAFLSIPIPFFERYTIRAMTGHRRGNFEFVAM